MSYTNCCYFKILKKNSADNSKLILFKLNYIILINLNKT